MSAHLTFATTAATGLRRDTPPMRLFEKAKRFGIWNPSEIDFRQDTHDWQHLTHLEQDVLLHLTALFQAGEEAVTGDILPLLLTVSQEGRVEEELYLTTFLFEEAKHTDFFRRFLDEVAGAHHDLSHYHSPSYREIIYTALPAAARRAAAGHCRGRIGCRQQPRQPASTTSASVRATRPRILHPLFP